MQPLTVSGNTISNRDEARSEQTTPERLHELISLPGDRGESTSDAGWCREYVAANPAAAAHTLAELAGDGNDVMCRRLTAQNPSTPDSALRTLVKDADDITANGARVRLGLPSRAAGHPRSFTPSTGRLNQ